MDKRNKARIYREAAKRVLKERDYFAATGHLSTNGLFNEFNFGYYGNDCIFSEQTPEFLSLACCFMAAMAEAGDLQSPVT